MLYSYELTEEQRKDFDYIPEEDFAYHNFVSYRGCIYDTSDFVTTTPGPWNHGLPSEFKSWDGYSSDSFFSGVLIRYNPENDDQVIMGTYIS